MGIAFQAYTKGEHEKIRKIIQQTKKPEWLRPSSRSYFFFLSAVVNTVDGDLEKAKKNLLEAIKLPFRTDHIKCLAYILLAEVYLDLSEKENGTRLFEMAKSINHRTELDPMLEKLSARIDGMA